MNLEFQTAQFHELLCNTHHEDDDEAASSRNSLLIPFSRVRAIPVLADETILIARLNSNDAIWKRRRTECGDGNIFMMNAFESTSRFDDMF